MAKKTLARKKITPKPKAQSLTPKSRKFVYFFGKGKADGHRGMKDLLGGKGAGLAEMTNAGLPVPAGMTISTEACTLYYKEGRKTPAEVDRQMLDSLKRLESAAGKKLGDVKNPLLVSVRSGAKFSMPGMMDTILNLGLNDETVEGLKARTSNGRFAFDSYRRFIQMFGNVVLEIPKEAFDHEFEAVKKAHGAKVDTDLDESALTEVVARYKTLVRAKSGKAFPQEPLEQLRGARDAVFRSWNNARAIEYRRIYDISDAIGTAVNVQMMVFGNSGDRSATGVGFTRNPATGAKEFYGEFLVNAQGEDVVSGVRTPQPITELERVMPKAYKQLRDITTRLEKQYKDVQDFEFTIDDDTLYMLQTRNGKRTGYAAVVIATDLVKEKLITPKDAVLQVDPESVSQLLAPMFDPKAWGALPVATKGLPASPGAAAGQAVFTADAAVEWTRQGKKVILVRKETVPDDIHGMFVAEGILTATGGMTSHAAVVGRQMGKPSIVGAGGLDISESQRQFTVGGHTVKEGDAISFDGLTGEVKLGQVATQPSEILQVVAGKMKASDSTLYQRFERLLEWADTFRRLGIRANADQPDQAETAYAFGARGIGLCRTEHMFFGEGRIAIVQRMILADNEADRRTALDELLPMQRDDFYGVFKAMKGQPVTIRTIDPPLHEFLPKREDLMVDIARLEAKDAKAHKKELEEKHVLLRRVEQLHEFNPMLGHRGVRLGITYPEITEMQTRAILEAACQLAKEGLRVIPEIMIPLVGHVKELRDQKAVVERVAAAVMKEQGVKIKFLIGTMIEVPRGAITADEIAAEAEFFSFGTNDLTQLTYGFSRDDIGKFLGAYQDKKILDKDPFASIDTVGVGQLVEMGVRKGRATRPNLKIGICGEHGGDPASVHFFDRAGLDYVSCSPYRVPVARLAAAQAALQVKWETELSRIHRLPSDLANQIAAGEVVERPASVVKELVENAIDAGARRISIAVDLGGKRLIRVEDDGEGMDPDDARLAIERHATSKIAHADDLGAIRTLGFRGEALPSIASVSHFTLRTRARGAPSGTEIKVNAGVVASVREVGAPEGTCIEVADLFYNLPARRKFLKSDTAETTQISRLTTQLALCYPEVGFTLTSGTRGLLQCPPAGSLRDRFFQLFGDRPDLVEVRKDAGGLQIEGYVAALGDQGPVRGAQNVFVNRRIVKDRTIAHAIGEAYSVATIKERSPEVHLFLRIAPDRVDVNVHPTKAEVRFLEQSFVHEVLRRALGDALGQGRAPEFQFAVQQASLTPGEPTPMTIPGVLAGATVGNRWSEERDAGFGMGDAGSGIGDFGSAMRDARSTDARSIDIRPMIPLGQFRDTFILAVDDEGIAIIDQHVAHERVLFEQVMERLTSGRLESQRLLTPILLELSPAPRQALAQHAASLERFGIELEAFGGDSVRLSSVPALLDPAECEAAVRALAEDLEGLGGATRVDDALRRIAATMACHAAVKANYPLTLDKMRYILEELRRTAYSSVCPHGRPVVLRLTRREIEKNFQRI